MEAFNFLEEEKQAANIARKALKASLISEIKRSFNRRSGALEKSNVTSRFKEGRLDRLVINTPKYSFTQHYGSEKSGTQKPTERKGTNVKSFQRHLEGMVSEVKAHERKGGSVVGFNKNEPYNAHDHLGRALKQNNALETLATSLGQSRATLITSKIRF